MRKLLCFDMDGTIADLYGVDNWLAKLRAEDPSPYLEAQPMWDTDALNNILMELISKGWEVQVISWLSKDSSPEYKAAVRSAKRAWLKRWGFPVQGCHLIAYGTTKANAVRNLRPDIAILIDDTAKVRDGWHLGDTIDPTSCDLLEELAKLAAE